MDAMTIYSAIDPFLIAPYRWFASSELSFWIGTAVLAIVCLVVGELALTLVYMTNRTYYAGLNKKMVRMHNVSIQAICSKDKAIFKAANTWANEYFGKVFFSQAALFGVSIWGLPFAMGWLQTRFEGITIYSIPYFGQPLGYTFVMLTCYIALRFGLSKIRSRIPVLSWLERIRLEDAKSAGIMQSWSDIGNDAPASGGEGRPVKTLVLSATNGSTLIEDDPTLLTTVS